MGKFYSLNLKKDEYQDNIKCSISAVQVSKISVPNTETELLDNITYEAIKMSRSHVNKQDHFRFIYDEKVEI